MNKIFADHVTSASFHLALSRNQIAVMQLIHLGCVSNEDRAPKGLSLREQGMNDTFVPSAGALQRKGLVIWEDPDKMKPKWSRFPYSLTPEGEKVFDLLVIAGLAHHKLETKETAA